MVTDRLKQQGSEPTDKKSIREVEQQILNLERAGILFGEKLCERQAKARQAAGKTAEFA
jgi:hypothetical protein